MPLLKSPPTLQDSCLDVVVEGLPQEEWDKPHGIALWLPKITSNTGQPYNISATLYQALLDHLIQSEQLQPWHLEHVAHESLKSLRLKECRNILDNDTALLFSRKCPNLKDVSFCCKQLPVRSMQLMLGSLDHLRVLNISFTPADDTIMKTLSRGCPELQELRITYTNVTDVGLFQLCGLGDSGEGCKKLTVLWMESLAYVTPCGVSYVIKALKQLRKVHTDHDIGLVVYGIYQELLLYNLPLSPLQLDSVSFLSASTASRSYMKAVLKLCPNFRNLFLDVEMIADMDEEILLSLSQLTLSAVEFEVANNDTDDDIFQRDVVPFLSKVGAKLEKVSFRDFSGVDMLAVGANCPKVQYLALSGAFGVAEKPTQEVKDCAFQNIEILFVHLIYAYGKPQESLQYQLGRVLKNAHKLQILHLKNVHCFTDDFMIDVLKYNKFTFLKTLDLIECHGVTWKTVEVLMNTAGNLSKVIVDTCDKLKKSDVDYLSKLAAQSNISFYIDGSFGVHLSAM